MRTLLARLNYLLGWSLFFSVARFSESLHTFAMGRMRRAADRGDMRARRFYGTLLLYKGIGPSSVKAGFDYLQQSAAAGDVDAQFHLAEIYAQGKLLEVPQNHALAVQYYQQAAAAGHTMAALRLAKAYQSGALGLPADASLADSWMKKFLDKGQSLHE